jgi:hypothetical protein
MTLDLEIQARLTHAPRVAAHDDGPVRQTEKTADADADTDLL